MRRPNGLRTKPSVTPGLAVYIHNLNVFLLFYSEGAETKRCFFSLIFCPRDGSARQQLNIFVKIPRASCLACLLTIITEIIQAGADNQMRFFLPCLGLGLTWVMDSWHFKARQLLSLFLSCTRNRQKQWSRFIRPNNEDICLSNSPAISSPLCTLRPSAEQNGSHKGKQLTPYAGKEREKGRKKKHSHKFQFNHVDFASCWHQQCTSEMTSIFIGIPPLLIQSSDGIFSFILPLLSALT